MRRSGDNEDTHIGSRRRAAAAWAAAALLLGLPGCQSFGFWKASQPELPTKPEKPAEPLRADQFPWERDVLKRSGASRTPPDTSPGAPLVAVNEARASALRSLMDAVRKLRVDKKSDVGFAMDQSSSLRLAVERVVARAQRVGEPQTASDGTVTVTLELPLEAVARALYEHRVTPIDGPPALPPEKPAAFPVAPSV